MNQTVLPTVILNGGRASRMGGCDKGMLMLAGQSMLERVIARIRPQSADIAISSNRDRAGYARFGLPILPDETSVFAGPLAGVLAAMDWAGRQGSSHVLTVPVDTPFLPRDLVARLCRNTGLSLAASGAGGAGRLHPTIGLWPLGLADDLREFLSSGKRKVRDFTAPHEPETVIWECHPVDPFLNVNTPEDLRYAETLVEMIG